MTHPHTPAPGTEVTVDAWQPPPPGAEQPVPPPPGWGLPQAGGGPAPSWGFGYGSGAQPPWGQEWWTPWPPAPPPPGRRRGRIVVAVLALLVAVATAAGTGIALGSRSTSSPATAAPSLAPLPTAPQQSSPPDGGSTGQLDASAVASKVDPGVVNIEVRTDQGGAAGTGMVLTPTGEVLTNNHVVEGSTSVSLQIAGTGRSYDGTVIGVDPADDVALVQMNGASGLPIVPLGNSSSVSVGDLILALGNAGGRGGQPVATQGTVTALDQTITASDANGANSETLTGMVEVRAAIQPGDSGGPIADRSGKVIAMTTAGSTRTRRAGSVGFGIPIDRALTIGRQIQSGSGPNVQPAHRGILGVEIDGGATGVDGAAVAQVQSGSPAEGAGIRGGDTITGIDSTTVDSADALSKALQGKRPGDTVTVRWTDRSGQQHSAQVKLASGPPA